MNRKIEISTLLGIITAIALIVIAIVSGEGNPMSFIDIKSILIVIFGTIFVTIGCYTFKDFLASISVIGGVLFFHSENYRAIAVKMVEIATFTYRKGILELDRERGIFPDDKFFRSNISNVIDGMSASDVEHIMDKEIYAIHQRHEKSVAILRKAAEIAPAMGLIGTLIGLVQMLGNLDDPSKIGPAMAIALLTTLYGAFFSYVILQPIATKLERSSENEVTSLSIMSDAIISIANKEAPTKLESKLNSYLPDHMRV